MHCKCALCGNIDQACVCSTASAGSPSIAGLSACLATCGRRHKSHKLFCGACLATARRAAAEHEDLGRTSTLELACDAGTPGTISAGDLRGCGAQAHLLNAHGLRPRSHWNEASWPAEMHLGIPFLLGHVRIFGSEVDGSMTLATSVIEPCSCGTPRTDCLSRRGIMSAI